ncbi:unnamed protein product [Rhizoctonia solani]|uniref:Uncharacterized protein n=1 Tax=Rhizoctonia solani TaxID=456999 RepID=A0A8H2WS46_9AGAM|nr:unnamed protein product [Rhizoctonia solani]
MERLLNDPFPDGLAVLLLRFLRQEPVLDAVDLIPPLLNASFSKIWSEIDTAKDASINLSENVNLIRYTTELFDLIERIYQVYAGTHEVLYPITQTLVNNDFVNLFGRITLLPLSVRSPIGTLANSRFIPLGSKERYLIQHTHDKGDVESFIDMDDMQDPHGLARSWFDLIFGDLHTSELSSEMRGSLNGVFDSFYPDWTKMRRCFTANFPQHSVSSKAFKQQVKGSLVAWGNFARSFGYEGRASKVEFLCMYPRCAGASMEESGQQMVCGRCMDTPYCSTLCQSK